MRHRLNVMQGGASGLRPWDDAVTAPRRAGAYLLAPSAVQCFCALALPLRGRICVRSRLLARVLRSCPRGIDRLAEHGYARASFSAPQSGEMELA